MRTAILTLALLTPATGALSEITSLEGHGGPIMSVAVAPDGQTALTSSFDNSVGYWDLATGEVAWLEGHEAAVKTVIFLGDGRAASAGDDFDIRLWDPESATPEPVLTGHKGQVKSLAVSDDGRLLASAGWDGAVGLWDLSTGEPIGFFEGHNGAVNDVAFTAGGTRIFSSSADGTIRLWRVGEAGKGELVIRHGIGATELLVDDRAGWLAFGAVDGSIHIVSLEDFSELADLSGEQRPILAMAQSPQGDRIAVGDGDGQITIISTETWETIHEFQATQSGPIWALDFLPDGSALLVGGIDPIAHIWTIGTVDDPVFATATPEFLRDPESMPNGERQFRRKCAVCHTLSDAGQRRAGPPLNGIFGRKAGSVSGYIYSEALTRSELIWSSETINQLFDSGPEHYIPGTKMPMQRITAPEDREDLIAFLKDNT